MAAGDINDPLSEIPGVALEDRVSSAGAPGAGFGLIESINGVLSYRFGTGESVPLVSLVAGLLSSLTEKVAPVAGDLLLLQDSEDSDALKKVDVDNLPDAGGGGLPANNIAVIANHLTSGNGGTATSGAWRTCPLNSEISDPGSLASLASDQVTLSEGTYLCIGYQTFYLTNGSQLRLYNVTDAATLLDAGMAYLVSSAGVSGVISIDGVFTVGASKTIELQYYVERTQSTNGLGYVPSPGQTTDVAKLTFIKLA